MWARIRRGRTKSLSGTTALATETTAGAGQGPSQQPETEPDSILERRIHPDLDALVADWVPPARPAAADADAEDATPSPFSPSPPPPLRQTQRRHSIDGTVPTIARRQTEPDARLGKLPELAAPVLFAPPPLSRTQRIMTRLKGSGSPSSSTADVSLPSGGAGGLGWSTFGRRDGGAAATRPVLVEFGGGGEGRDSPAPSHGGTSVSHSFSQSQAPEFGTPSSMSQQLDESVTYSQSGHGHGPASPESGLTFGSQGHLGRGTLGTPPPPMPPLDHPVFGLRRPELRRSPGSGPQPRTPPSPYPGTSARRGPRGSASLPSMHAPPPSRKRFPAKAQDIFSAFTRSRRASDVGETNEGEVVVVALAGGRGSGDGDKKSSRRGSQDVNNLADARAKRVDTSQTTAVWPDVPAAAHSPESSDSTTAANMPETAASALQKTASSGTDGSPDTVRSTKSVRLPTELSEISRGKRRATEIDGEGGRSERPSRQVSTSSSPPTTTRQKQKLGRASFSENPQPISRSGTVRSTVGPSAGNPALARSPSRASSLPISALVTPHAPSVISAGGSSYYHMRDPRKVRVEPTGWALTLTFGRDSPRPRHAWLFFLGFVVFPLWWVAAFVGVPTTRRLATGTDAEKNGGAAAGHGQVVLDDPQVEFDARTWRKRCRIMAAVSLVTYIPFIVLLAVFIKRN
ncbi:hypothetical protein MKEN_00628400 [Mycena kentingensis (nom. inval.)]|nr:hypothetical protein MKEN_00628400 [Mycena kentingensis (nom. inval.)]